MSNYTPRSTYSPASDSLGSFSNYRKYVDSKLNIEKKALQNSYVSVMKSINQRIMKPSPSHIVCVKSAPIDSDSDDQFRNPAFSLPNQSPIKKLRSNTEQKNYTKSSNQQMMELFNEFDASLQSFQNEIVEIKRMISKNSPHSTTQ